MTELAIVSNTPRILNPELKKATDLLVSIDASIKAKQFDIASILGAIETKGLYKDDGFASTAEYAMQVFGLSKTVAYELITIGKEYTRPIMSDKGKVIGHCSNLVPACNPEKQDRPLVDFTMSQLSRIIRLGREKVLELVQSGELKPSMTVKEIVEVVKANKPPKAIPGTSEDTTATPETPATPATTETPASTPATPDTPETPVSTPDPAPEMEETAVNTTRGDGFDNLPTDVLIAELRLRGFTVYHNGAEMRYHWGE